LHFVAVVSPVPFQIEQELLEALFSVHADHGHMCIYLRMDKNRLSTYCTYESCKTHWYCLSLLPPSSVVEIAQDPLPWVMETYQDSLALASLHGMDMPSSHMELVPETEASSWLVAPSPAQGHHFFISSIIFLSSSRNFAHASINRYIQNNVVLIPQ
jgi:hypothetical protein